MFTALRGRFVSAVHEMRGTSRLGAYKAPLQQHRKTVTREQSPVKSRQTSAVREPQPYICRATTAGGMGAKEKRQLRSCPFRFLFQSRCKS